MRLLYCHVRNEGMNITSLCIQQYEFSLEHRVLTGLQGGFAKQQFGGSEVTPSSGLLPSCPPYWMMFNTSQQPSTVGRHGSDIWETNPRQRPYSLNPATVCTKPVISDSEHEATPATDKVKKNGDGKCTTGGFHIGTSRQRGQRKGQKAFVPDFLNPPTCLSSLPHQRRKNLRQCSLSELEVTKQHDLKNESQNSPSSQGSTTGNMRASPYHRSQTIDCHGITPEVSNTHFKSRSVM